MKTYSFDKKTFMVEVTLTGIFAGGIMIYSLVNIVMGNAAVLFAIVLLVAAYTAWNDFISISNPDTVKINENSISFLAYGREHSYLLSDIKNFRIREFPSSGKIFLRVNKSGLLKGRYWIHTKMFDDGKELFDTLRDMEYNIHPDSLKARARRVNTEYIRAQKG